MLETWPCWLDSLLMHTHKHTHAQKNFLYFHFQYVKVVGIPKELVKYRP
jgi:hypothetical protein